MAYISGFGILSSIGIGVPEYTQALKEGVCGIKNHSVIPCIAEMKSFLFQEKLNKYSHRSEILKKALAIGQRTSLAMQATILCVLEAWDNSQFAIDSYSTQKERVGIIIAGHNLNSNLSFECYSKYFNTPEYVNPRYAIQFMDSDYLGTLSEIFDIHGGGFSTGGSSASGNIALIKGYESIKAGYLDMCIIVAPPANLGPLELRAFYNLGAMGGKKFKEEPEKACRPFDK